MNLGDSRDMEYLRRVGIQVDDVYEEDQLRSIAELKIKHGEVTWFDILRLVFYNFTEYSVDFKREVRQNAIKEATEHKLGDQTKAIQKIDEEIAECIVINLSCHFAGEETYNETYRYLYELKRNNLFEFINVKHLLNDD